MLRRLDHKKKLEALEILFADRENSKELAKNCLDTTSHSQERVSSLICVCFFCFYFAQSYSPLFAQLPDSDKWPTKEVIVQWQEKG